MRQLNYEPNDAAQKLVRRVDRRVRRTHNIGLILGQVSYKFSDPFWSPVLDGVDEELIRHEYHLRFAFTIDDLQSASRRSLLNRAHVDGLILLGNVSSFGGAIDPRRTVLVSPPPTTRGAGRNSYRAISSPSRSAGRSSA